MTALIKAERCMSQWEWVWMIAKLNSFPHNEVIKQVAIWVRFLTGVTLKVVATYVHFMQSGFFFIII